MAVTVWIGVQASLRAAHSPGLSHFGSPGSLGPLLGLATLAAVASLLTARTRLATARRLTLLLLVATLLPGGPRSGGLVPAEPGLLALLTGLLLVLAAPRLHLHAHPLASGRVATLALLAALPALFGSLHPHGGLLWLVEILPALALAVLLPSLFCARDVGLAARLLVYATALACLLALADYLSLARGLDLPLSVVARTRLHLLDIHPNLAVPHLAVTLVLGTALAWRAAADGSRRRRHLLLLALLPCLGALLAIRSRTGFLVSGAGLMLLAGSLRGGPWTRLWRPLAAAAVTLAILVPCTGLVDDDVARLESDKVSKAWIFRASMWGLGRNTLAAAPWHGFGPHTRYVQGRFAAPGRYDGLPKDDHPHNVALLVGQSLGWPGLAALALLLAASFRRAREGPPAGAALRHAADAGLLVVWGANAIDLGGADRTLYPTLVLLLLGLREAAGQAGLPPPPGHPGHRGRPLWRLGVAVTAVAAALLGTTLAVGTPSKVDLRRAVDRLPPAAPPAAAPPTSTASAPEAASARDDLADLAGRLTVVERLLPLDPEVAVLQARVAARQGDAERARERWERAAALMRGDQRLLHGLAQARLAAGERDAFGLLDEVATAEAADPHGAHAWRVQLDLAALRMATGNRAGALDVLLQALIVNPGAAARLPVTGPPDAPALVLDPSRADGAGRVPLQEILAELERRRADLRSDTATDLRLRMRQVEVARAMGATARADRLADELLADQPLQRVVRLAEAALADGRWDAALAHLDELGDRRAFHHHVNGLQALSQREPLDVTAFAAALEATYAALDDVKFEAETVARLLAARRRVAERQGDAVAAARLVDAVDFARR